ncbi:Glycosyltransferase involved in cell wall bisynthesis [Bradyrhizobium shewense]|uniref:Glycosyltransferase involved in cell wall bisynthesis n=1 Tax=Bradyrhizobium shewense TaxID=1761772 RepID=A0A1C3WR83_9BRAD|nr:glycosyltransferase [Bradyrhizobium shewense]SCB42572.1 Glycosyltransferase involved in cell wall bisynthesis [Bradyrhizobium shewense]
MKILIYLTGGLHWIGGVQYTRNLLRALALLPASERPQLVLQISSKNRLAGFEDEFRTYPNVLIDAPLKVGHDTLSKLRRAFRKLSGRELQGKFLLSDECVVAFPAKGPNIPGPSQKIYWVPDFQYKHFPEFFSSEELKSRDAMYNRMFAEPGILVLSSEAAKQDFHRFFPQFEEKPVRILHFVSTFAPDDFAADPLSVCTRFALPNEFVYLPNQLWQHKGHDTAFRALGILKQRGIQIPLVCTGSNEDYRTNEYGRHLDDLLKSYSIHGQTLRLGLLDRRDQIQLYRQASLVLQPSRFEGWSTTVEDARALGKTIVLSDIDVHKEQNPANAVFFAVDDHYDLAEKLLAAWNQASHQPRLENERLARREAVERSLRYARDFLSIAKAAAAGRT